jgi:ferrochelatase
LRAAVGRGEEDMPLTFQSRLGRAEWLTPYTDETFAALGERGVKRIAAIMPGFAADCVETLEEIAIEGGKTFRAAGGEAFAAIPCLNASKPGMDMLETITRRELGGWA